MHFAAWLCVQPKDVEDAVRRILPRHHGPETETHRGASGWGNFFRKKKRLGVSLNYPPEKITYPALGKGKIIDSKMIFEWDIH